MLLSEADSGRIRGIDGRPAFEHYRKTLGMEDGDDLQLAEFPLLFERGGGLIARNPISLESDGSIRVIADISTGDRARLGYLDMAGHREGLQATLGRARGFSPQAIYLYSCVCRRYALQEETEKETMPFQEIAPTAGALTAGEFCHLDGRPQLLNFSELAVALREGQPSPPQDPGGRGREARENPPNPSSERHARLTSHLISFISTLSEELGSEVAERKRAEDEAKAVAEEKARLLRELQHRIKNSMALISSMASIEAQTARSPEARDSLMRLEARIAALASLYELLYTTGSIEEIALSDYLGRVVDFAAKGLGAAERGIGVERYIAAISLDVKRAIPLGLLVNELITDSVKHAFPGRARGRIEVRLSRQGGLLVLIVRDDGVGLPAGLDLDASQGFGLSLAKSLAAQLDASFSARSEGGAVFELRMPL
jgi:two-component sensor histidine kinase